ncbi:glycosyltransferase family 2 protein [Halosimplex aquaticum]
MKLSIVVPVYNENGNLVDLHAEITETLGRHYEDWEIIFVDDGSTDGSYDQLAELSTRDRHVKVIRLRGNFGQSAALDAGLQAAKYDVIVTMDADGQNDPADIPRLVDRLEEGYDCVSGWRKDRDDPSESERRPGSPTCSGGSCSGRTCTTTAVRSRRCEHRRRRNSRSPGRCTGTSRRF